MRTTICQSKFNLRVELYLKTSFIQQQHHLLENFTTSPPKLSKDRALKTLKSRQLLFNERDQLCHCCGNYSPGHNGDNANVNTKQKFFIYGQCAKFVSYINFQEQKGKRQKYKRKQYLG